ncbi:MAG: tetratricopeptide repeat protein [Actinomycetia bacterium]|nr:tetratricopeptide repeat protein [Actinomycetes bacterium]
MSRSAEQRAEELLQAGHSAVNDSDLSRAVEQFTRCAQAYAQVPGAEEEQALVLGLAGQIHEELEQPEEAESAYQEALRLFFTHVPGSEKDQGLTMASLGHLMTGQERFAAAIPHFAAALSALTAAGDTGSPDLIGTYMGLGMAHINSAEPEQGAAAYQRAIELLRTLPEASTELGVCWMGLGIAFTQLEDDALAQRGFDQALRFFEQHPGNAPFVAETLTHYATLHEHSGRNEQALAAYERARDIYAAATELEAAAECTAQIDRLRDAP